MNYNLVLTPEAEDDFQDILIYTEERWGEKQREQYATQLNSALQLLEDNPRLGKKKPSQLPPIYQAYHIARHYIIYRVEGPDILVFRILHDQMDLKRHIH